MRPFPSRFRLLWAATAVSNLGDGVRSTALPLLATELTRNPGLVAGVAIAERVPWLIFILPGGAWADRYDRKKLRVGLDLARAVIVAVIAVLVATDNATIVAVFAAAALLSSAESIVDSSSMALVPSLVEKDDLERSAGVLSATELTLDALIGPPLGGVLFAAALWLPFGVDAVSFTLAALLALSIRGSFRPTPTAQTVETPRRRRMTSEIRAGMSWLWNQPLLRNLALVSTVLGTASFIASSVLVLFAQELLGLGPTGFGLLLVPAAVGGSIGSGIAPRLRDQPLRRVLTIAVVVAGLTGIAISVSSNAVVVGGLLAAQYAAILVWNVLTLALRQRLIPDELLGRGGSSYRFLVFVGMPIGAAIGGLFASVVGLRETFALSGLIIVAAAFFLPTAVKASPTPPVAPPAPPPPLPPPRLDSPSLLPPGTAEVTSLRLPPPDAPRVGPPLPPPEPPEPPGRPTPPSRSPQRRRSRRPRRRQRNKR